MFKVHKQEVSTLADDLITTSCIKGLTARVRGYGQDGHVTMKGPTAAPWVKQGKLNEQ